MENADGVDIVIDAGDGVEDHWFDVHTVKNLCRKNPINVYAAIYIYNVWDFYHTTVYGNSHTDAADSLDRCGISPIGLCGKNLIPI